MINITLLCTDKARHTEISKELLIPLVESIAKNGKEIVHTNQGSYTVEAVVVGEVKGKVLIL